MKKQLGTRIKSVGNLIWAAVSTITFSVGVLTGYNLFTKSLEEEYHLLPKEYYECFVGMTLKDEVATKICVAYRIKGVVFDGNNHPRHREYNQEQGKRIHRY